MCCYYYCLYYYGGPSHLDRLSASFGPTNPGLVRRRPTTMMNWKKKKRRKRTMRLEYYYHGLSCCCSLSCCCCRKHTIFVSYWFSMNLTVLSSWTNETLFVHIPWAFSSLRMTDCLGSKIWRDLSEDGCEARSMRSINERSSQRCNTHIDPNRGVQFIVTAISY